MPIISPHQTRAGTRFATPRLTHGLLATGLLLACGLSLPLAAQVPGVIQPFNNASELFLRANRFYDYGRDIKDVGESRRALKMAIPLYREYLNTGPQGGVAEQALHQLAMSLLLTGELDDAERTFRLHIDRFRAGNWVAESAYRLAAQLYNRQEWMGAAPYFSITVREAADASLRHKAIFYEARCYTYAKKGTEAITRLESIINDPTNPFRDYARLSIGQLHQLAGRHEKALEQFELLLDPRVAGQERAQAMLAAGVSAAKLGQQEKAEEFLNSTIDSIGLDPKYKAQAQFSLMEMCYAVEDYAGVVKVFRRGEFVGENELMAKLYMMAGKSLAKLDRHNEAIRQFFNAERLAPLTELAFEASYRRLSSFFQINGPNIPGQVDAFVEIYAERHPSSPWLHTARLMKAEILFHQGGTERAAAAYNQINPAALPEELRADVYFKRGWCLSDTGDFTRATQNLSSFISKYPDHPSLYEALAKRGHAYLQLGDRGSALKDFERILEGDVDEKLAAFAQQHCGRIHHDEHNYQKMIDSYNALLTNHANLGSKTIANANYWVGWGYFTIEKWREAIPYLERARNLAPAQYQEAAGTYLVLAAYSLLDSDLLKEAATRLLTDVPGQRLPARLLIWLGLERFTKGDYEGADRFLTLASTPDEPGLTDVIVWRHLGKARNERGHFERALETFDILLKQPQEDFWKADAFLDRSHALLLLERWDEARQTALDGLDLDPQGTVRAGLYMALADVAMKRKDYESAAASYLRTSELFIDDQEIKPLALFYAAKALELNGQAAESEKIRRQLRDEFPEWKPVEEKAEKIAPPAE